MLKITSLKKCRGPIVALTAAIGADRLKNAQKTDLKCSKEDTLLGVSSLIEQNDTLIKTFTVPSFANYRNQARMCLSGKDIKLDRTATAKIFAKEGFYLNLTNFGINTVLGQLGVDNKHPVKTSLLSLGIVTACTYKDDIPTATNLKKVSLIQILQNDKLKTLGASHWFRNAKMNGVNFVFAPIIRDKVDNSKCVKSCLDQLEKWSPCVERDKLESVSKLILTLGSLSILGGSSAIGDALFVNLVEASKEKILGPRNIIKTIKEISGYRIFEAAKFRSKYVCCLGAIPEAFQSIQQYQTQSGERI